MTAIKNLKNNWNSSKTYIIFLTLLTIFFLNVYSDKTTYANQLDLSYIINEDASAYIEEYMTINVKKNNYKFEYIIPHNENEKPDYVSIVLREFDENKITTYNSIDSSNDKFTVTKHPKGTSLSSNDIISKGNASITLKYGFANYVHLYKDTALLERTILSDDLFKNLKTSIIKISFSTSKIDFKKLNVFVSGNTMNDISQNKLGDVEISLDNIDFNKPKKITVLMPSHYIFKNKNIIPKDMFDKVLEKETLLEKENIKIRDAYLKNKVEAKRITLFSVVSSTIFFVSSYIYLQKRFLRKIPCDFDKKYYPAIPGNYSPFETAYLLFNKKITTNTLIASLFDLVQRDYLVLDIYTNTNFRFGRGNRKDFHNLKKSEQFLMKWLINEIGNSYFFDIVTFEKIGSNMFSKNIINANFKKWVLICQKESSRRDFYVKTSPIPYNVFFVNIVFSLLLMITNIVYYNSYTMVFFVLIEFIFIYIFTYTYNYKLSAYGQEQFLKWYAFKNYIIDFDKFSRSSKKIFSVWERYIVHSFNLNITEEVLETTTKLFNIDDTSESKLFGNFLKTDLHETMILFLNCCKSMKCSISKGFLHYKRKW